ncbi:MAG: DUF262 domain-containing protein, partial [Ignavibacteria bacterium]|nr:DUF262 domain-containing protein [Ignavibacteria bacterium]
LNKIKIRNEEIFMSVTKTEPIIDESEKDKEIISEVFDTLSYGADFDVAGLVNRLNNFDIIIPPFQRSYIWTQIEASSFIESLLLGLPVPGIFLAREKKSKKLLVIDGQQRLKSLQFFYDGYFNPKKTAKTKKVFRLINVVKSFDGIKYSDLDDTKRRDLDNSLIHATIMEQKSEKEYDPIIYQVFKRLNTAGRNLAAQEIRISINHGSYADLLKELNEHQNWRNIFGVKHKRLKDQELILRFLAMYFRWKQYEKPMNEFLNHFISDHSNADKETIKKHKDIFIKTINKIWESLSKNSFRMKKGIIAAILDSVMVGVAIRLESKKDLDNEELFGIYTRLLKDKNYINAIEQHTSDSDKVAFRFKTAIEYFK